MCGRFTQKDDSDLPGIVAIRGDATVAHSPRYNGAPSQDFWVIRRHPETGQYHRDRLIWGLIPHWVKEPDGGRKPINARAETIAKLPSFQSAYARRRCIVPVNNFFEWRKTTPPKQPFAIAMADGSPFGIAGLWESWTHPLTGEIVRTFCVITCPANDLIAPDCERIELETLLDEHNLTVFIRYAGKLPELTNRRPSPEEMIEHENGPLRMAGYLVQRLADGVRTRMDGNGAEIRLVFRD